MEHDPVTETYSMTEEQAFALANPEGGVYVPGAFVLGAQAGEGAIRQITADAGFTLIRRAAETPFNLVYEVRP